MLLKTVPTGVSFVLIATVALAQSFNNINNSFNNNHCTAFGNGNVIVCNPGRVGFSEELGDLLISGMPDKSKKISLVTVGNDTDQQIGSQVQQFLTQHGYSVERMAAGMLAPPPNGPYTLQLDGKQYNLTVAPTAH